MVVTVRALMMEKSKMGNGQRSWICLSAAEPDINMRSKIENGSSVMTR
jgi:hypothetical protein